MDGNDSRSGAKRQTKRNSETRRQQNRIASRNYRQKRKDRLALLDQLLAPGSEQEWSQASSNANSSAVTLINPHGPLATSGHSELPLSDDPFRALTNHGWSNEFDLPGPGVQRNLDDVSIGSIGEETEQAPSAANIWSWKSGEDMAMPTSTARSESIVMSSHGRSQGKQLVSRRVAQDPIVVRALDRLQHLTHAQKRELIEQLQEQAGDSSQPYSKSESRQSDLPTVTNWVVSQKRTGAARTRLQDEARRFADFIDKFSSGRISPAQLSRIFVEQTGFFGAIFANCYALGMTGVESLVVEEGVSVFSIDPDTGWHASQLPAVRPRFAHITPDLRPQDAQLTVGHHPYLDVVPFKTFRENALRALEHDPTGLDEDELCSDLSTGALICWGAQQNSLGMEAGVPWDARSWEPKPWFLNKYRHLVGGWDEEMWKSARFWHNLRGEKLQLTS